jgi:TIR domain
MADICLIYARPSRVIVKALYDVLSRRYSVWWDEKIHSGDYRTEIERQLKHAKCVVPIWCGASRDSRNVVDEADYAREHGVALLPVRIEDVKPPLGFGGLQTVDLLGWKGDPESPSVKELFSNIEHIILARPAVLRIGEKKLEVPTFFRSVSSHETALQPAAAIQALKLVSCNAVLVSAYDIIYENNVERRSQIITDLESLQAAGSVILLDSGNFREEKICFEGEQDNAKHYRKKRRIQPHHRTDRGVSGKRRPPVDSSMECGACRRPDYPSFAF